MKRPMVLAPVILLAVVAEAGHGGEAPQPAPPAKSRPQPKVQYARDIQPILAANCFLCHGPDEKNRKARLRLDLPETATTLLKSGVRAIVPGNTKDSELVARIHATDSEHMPPSRTRKQLTDSEKQLLTRWIAEGAAYQKHWAYVSPQRSPLPALTNESWPKNLVDHFVLARLESEGLQPAPEADRYTLARRLALDLTGLPPTLGAVNRFVNDERPDAFERYVDYLLQLPAYGERWAQVWLDLARYADSNGYAEDRPRTIWRYRDCVIDALNANIPFDQFTLEQIAGDLLPNASNNQLLATAFHRNTLTNTEGGTSDEEFRVAAVVDRVNTTMQVWMGLTLACAQCHDHKFDPFSQEEYFRLYAIFNQTQDNDQADNSPLLSTPSRAHSEQKAKLEQEIAATEKELNKNSPELETAQKCWEVRAAKDISLPSAIQAILAVDPGKRQPRQQAELTKYFRSIAPEVKKTRDRLSTLRKQLSTLVREISTPIQRELPEGKKRTTRIHVRGNFLNQGKEVIPGVPAILPPLPKDQPPNRLALARWLVDPSNPLTARVTVNRYWEQIFGVGLVETPEDFGSRGKPPTHPDLLDWLATEFVAQKWDVKKLLRLLVTSATYRQSARLTPELAKRDPDNRLFARSPRFRSGAEVIRDQVLFASGLLSPKLHGPPVRPPQPKLGLKVAFGSDTDWEPSRGEDKYRRALYTQWQRTTPYPSMLTFDAPGRTVCTVNRPRTNTPLQALVTLNDPVYIEAAQALARRMVQEGGTTAEARARHGFRLCLTRPPTKKELARLVDLHDKVRATYSRKPADALVMANSPLGPLPAGMDPVDLAAWTLVANVILNLDEMFAKR